MRCVSDINQAGLGVGCSSSYSGPVRWSLKTTRLVARSRSVSGRYHDIGSFAGDIANLSRIVNLHNMTHWRRAGSGASWAMDATARTYPLLTRHELEQSCRRPRPGGGEDGDAQSQQFGVTP